MTDEITFTMIHAVPKTQVSSSKSTKPVKTSKSGKSQHNSSTSRKAQQLSRHADLLGTVGFQTSKDELIPTDGGQSGTTEDDSFSKGTNALAPLKLQTILLDDLASSTRPTSAIRFHSKYDNVLLSAHGARTDGHPGSALGTIGVWAADVADSTSALQRTLISSAAVTALELFPISPTLVLGGTVIGSIHIWDLRVKTALPVSAFDKHAVDISDCHGREAVTSVRTTGTSSPYFITTSANGHICKWSLSQPSGPLSQAIADDPVLSDKIPVTTMDLPRATRLAGDGANRAPSLFVGTAHGAVCRIEADGKRWGVAPERGNHFACVTAVRAHPAGFRVPHLDDVLASSSLDWGVNVWHFRRGHECKLLWSHDNGANGAVNDVAWSSLHPSVLCYADDAGVLTLHDLSGHLRNEANGTAAWKFAPHGKGRRPALTALQWSNNDRFVCTGDKAGNIALWSTTSHMASLPDAEWMSTFLKSKASQA